MTLSRGLPLMQFTLIYDGPLPSAGNKNKKEDKWAIRRRLDPQLRQLWAVNPDLASLAQTSVIRKDGMYQSYTPHHTAQASMTISHAVIASPGEPQSADVDVGDVCAVPTVDLCKLQTVGGVNFLPLVRDSLALTCGLKIQFLRQGAKGNVYQGGDMDGRIKLLFDALSVPQDKNEMCPDADAPNPIYCLLENDRLITGYSIESQQLLTFPDKNENWVQLIITVDVRVSRARPYNTIFLSD